MNVSFGTLFTVAFNHNYFAGKQLKKLRVVPFEKTLIECRKLGCLFKQYDDGFVILYDRKFVVDNRQREDVLKLNKTFRFCVFNEDPLFYNYTDGLAQYRMDGSLLYLTNLWSDKNSLRLHKKEFVETGDIINKKIRVVRGINTKPLGIISINFNRIKEENYFVHFNARSTVWRYILATDYLQALEKPAIINKDDNSVFLGPVEITLRNKKKVISFTSKSPIGLSERPNRNFQLVENFTEGNGKFKVVLKQLPNPDINNFSVSDENGVMAEVGKYSEIII